MVPTENTKEDNSKKHFPANEAHLHKRCTDWYVNYVPPRPDESHEESNESKSNKRLACHAAQKGRREKQRK